MNFLLIAWGIAEWLTRTVSINGKSEVVIEMVASDGHRDDGAIDEIEVTNLNFLFSFIHFIDYFFLFFFSLFQLNRIRCDDGYV